jgi:hypothetical protein
MRGESPTQITFFLGGINSKAVVGRCHRSVSQVFTQSQRLVV